MNIIVLDLVSNNYNDLSEYNQMFDNANILALSPSSFYYLEKNNIKFDTFHSIITEEKFRNEVIEIYDDILIKNSKNKYFKGYFRNIAQYICQFFFIENIISYVSQNKYKEIIYITDKKSSNDLFPLSNNISMLTKFITFDKIIIINKKEYKIEKGFLEKIKSQSFSSLSKKIINRFKKNKLDYDWQYVNIKSNKENVFIEEENCKFDIGHDKFKNINIPSLEFKVEEKNTSYSLNFTFLSKDDYPSALNINQKNKKIDFFQHGSYLYKNLFIKYSEVELANRNFVFNEFTKKYFEELNANKVYSVGSVLFDKPIKNKNIEFDFLYITQGHDYLGSIQYIDFPDSLHSFDGYGLYKKHKEIIELFGKEIKNKIILIRVHPCIITTGVYSPLLELSNKYENVTIDLSIPINNLIERSEFIISDYFTSEFINRDIHYKKDILLFDSAPTPLPKETIEDMKKMFILIKDVNDLKYKVLNINEISKNRIRDDDIIEYYSSKKCDTKKTIKEIYERD